MKPCIAISFLVLCVALPTGAKSIEIPAEIPSISSRTFEENGILKQNTKRDRDSETCSDRGCGRYLKERGSGRIKDNGDAVELR